MGKILVVDDDEYRQKTFAKQLADHDVWHAYNFKQAVDFLETQSPFSSIFLDHDLGETATGYDIAVYIAEKLPVEHRPRVIVVHSHNVVGAERMVRTLKAAGIAAAARPFAP